MKACSISALFAASLLLSGCGVLNALSPYKLDIPQGNEVTADQVAQLKAGMSRGQVRFLLGTPLLQDPFHSDRWDYVYSDARGGSLKRHFAFTVFFDGDTLTRWQGSTLPVDPNSKFARSGDAASAAAAADKTEPTQDTVSVQPLTDEAKQ
ncbi:outer membrane protein assembly factor BamE [Chitinilyticum aquatile]|uniref:outer membrane protein assembly factor BamE n=1 Tax=Chitinilyticum aquatile TaxID=362520 RepID=UPI00040B1A6A|nr:outer membrane protein assembly factor BamE [Chitinilyticum aquatile]